MPATMELVSVRSFTYIQTTVDSHLKVHPIWVGVIAFLAACLLLAGEYFFPQMSSVKTRRHYVMGDAGFSGKGYNY